MLWNISFNVHAQKKKVEQTAEQEILKYTSKRKILYRDYLCFLWDWIYNIIIWQLTREKMSFTGWILVT